LEQQGHIGSLLSTQRILKFQWHSNIRRDFSMMEEFAILETVLGCSHIVFHTMRLTSLSSDIVMDENLLDIRMNNGVEALNIPCSVLFHFRDDKIFRSEEYIDGMAVPLMNVPPTPATQGGIIIPAG
jgi:hypothetical protein